MARFAAVFASGTLLSRVFGLVRDVLLLGLIPSSSLGPFLIAFRLPNMLRELIGEGAVNAAFVPVLSGTREREGEAAFQRAAAACMGAVLLVLLVLSALGSFGAPVLLQGLNALQLFTGAPELDPAKLDQYSLLARWTFPYLFLIGMAVFASAPLYIRGHYATPSWSPVLLNVALIGACLALRDTFGDPAWALVAGVWLGGVAQWLVNHIAMARVSGVVLPRPNLRHPAVARSLVLLGPVLLGQAASEVNKLVDALFAAQLGDAVVTALYAANRLVQLPLSMFGLGVSAALLPLLSKAAARKDSAALRDGLVYGLRLSLFLMAPAMAGLIALREPIVVLLFERGAFTADDTARTASALGIYAAGLFAFGWVRVLVAGFYAQEDTRRPVICSSLSMVLNIGLNMALVGPFGYRGLAFATAVSFGLNALLLFAWFSWRTGNVLTWYLAAGVARTGLAAAGCGAVAWWVQHVAALRLPELTGVPVMQLVGSVGAGVLSGVAAYGLLQGLLGAPELRRLLQRIRG